MTDNTYNILHNFEKPDNDFIKDKECLICLESIDIEAQKIVKLPCKCTNSVYHIICITELLKSGQNKNFCPHCKKIYTLTPTNVAVEPFVLRPLANDNGRIRMFITILYVHIFSNSLMNVINISESKDYPEEDDNIVSKLLLICYFCKCLYCI